MPITKSALDELLIIHRDRRTRLYDFLETVPEDILTRPASGPWGNIVGMLAHSVRTEAYWIHEVARGQSLGLPRSAYVSDLAAVRGIADTVNQATSAYLASLDDSALAALVADDTGREFPVSMSFLHAITHDVYHRGQVLLLVQQSGRDVPDLDYL